jgi:hypothetical protein
MLPAEDARLAKKARSKRIRMVSFEAAFDVAQPSFCALPQARVTARVTASDVTGAAHPPGARS